MAMPPTNGIATDKFQIPIAAAGASELHGRQWFPDERDGFISWLRGEFAAANAMIDSLCHHLRSVGEPGEYDAVIGSIQNRRCNWSPVIHMQQYFSVADVTNALNLAAWRKQQRILEQGKFGAKDFKRSGLGFKQGHNAVSIDLSRDSNETKSGVNVEGELDNNCLKNPEDQKDSKTDAGAKAHADNSSKNEVNSEASTIGSTENQTVLIDDNRNAGSKVNHSNSEQNHNEKQSLTSSPKTFAAAETYDGRSVNVVDGLKLYDDLFDGDEVLKLVSLVNDLRVGGKKGQLQGQAYIVSKRPMKGRGREMIQLGLPIVDAPGDGENAIESSKDRKIEPIPDLLRDIIERLVATQVTSVKPDSCIVDFYNEGDHSQPHMCPSWFERPICVMFLSECDLTFGRVIVPDQPGAYRGSFKLSLSPGSLLVMQGKSADFAKHAINSTKKQRILITFTKSQPRRPVALPAPSQVPQGGPQPSRSSNHVRHPPGLKHHYSGVPSAGVLPAPSMRSQVPNSNGAQPIFMTSPIVPPMPFPSPVPVPSGSTVWPAPGPRHPQPRIAVPGTGVFLPPPGSSNSTSLITADTASTQEKDNCSSQPEACKTDTRTQEQDCIGNIDVTVKEEGQTLEDK